MQSSMSAGLVSLQRYCARLLRVEDNLVAITALVVEYRAAQHVEPHVHGVAQLVYACSGVLRTTTVDEVFVLSPQRALLVPAGVTHRHDVSVAASMRTLYLPAWVEAHNRCQLLAVNRLAGELIPVLAARRYDEQKTDSYLAVLRDQLRDAPRLALGLPISRDPVVARITDSLIADPADPAGPSQWGHRVGVSGRTIARRFRTHTGLTFDQWRRRARILRAMELRAQGNTLDACAHAVGYATASAFANAFKAVTGLTPSAILQIQGEASGATAADAPDAK
jgi:AraC-like DNA-binding protein/quercetin dioxygenase-like cupin family protein